MKSLIVITGASSGIGAATARAFSAAGHALLLLARRTERLEALALPNSLCMQVDVRNREQIRIAIEQAEALYGPVDALINNAGLMQLGQLDTQHPSEWQDMFDINVMGILNGIHGVLAGMKSRQHGTIIDVSSIAGRKTFADHAAYCGSKFAVHAISENLREEVAMDNIRVVTIAPGAVETELLSHTRCEAIKAGYQDWKNNMGGAIVAEDVAASIMYAYQQPQNVCIREIVIAATGQQP